MAKLSAEFLDEGRALLRAKNLDGFMEWVARSGVVIDRDMVRRSFKPFLEYAYTDRAISLFDKTFPDMDPVRDAYVIVVKSTVAIVLIVGALYGFVSLLWGAP